MQLHSFLTYTLGYLSVANGVTAAPANLAGICASGNNAFNDTFDSINVQPIDTNISLTTTNATGQYLIYPGFQVANETIKKQVQLLPPPSPPNVIVGSFYTEGALGPQAPSFVPKNNSVVAFSLRSLYLACDLPTVTASIPDPALSCAVMFTCTVGSEQTAHNITTTLKYEANSDFQFYEFGPRFQTLPLSKCIISVKSNVLGVEGVVPVALLMDNIVGNATTTDCPE